MGVGVAQVLLRSIGRRETLLLGEIIVSTHREFSFAEADQLSFR